jgi:gliding motility-associated-like protein
MGIKALQTKSGKDRSRMIRASVLCCALLLPGAQGLYSQVITNEGAAISIIPGTVVGSGDLLNNPGGNLLNDGTINLSDNYTSTATTGGNGLFTLGGSWTNTGGTFIPGTSTVIFNGADNQSIIRSGGETFYNITVANSGAPAVKSLGISNNVNVLGTLTMSLGNIDAGTYVLYLSNPSIAALNYTSTTQSRIFGRFERGVNATGIYLFPLGTPAFYNPANLIINSALSAGSVLSQYLALDPGNAGLPIPDPPVEIHDRYPDGYWSMTANNGFSIGNFSINMVAAGFADTIRDVTRVIKRTAGGNWTVDGVHGDAVGSTVFRNNLAGGISSSGTQFALGRIRPLIITHPQSLTVCENTNPVFTVEATGAEKLKYTWYKEPGILIENGPHYSGARTASLTIIGAVLSDAGDYYCIVSDRYRNSTRSNNATLVVMKIPKATASPNEQTDECSNVAFDNIVLGLSYWDPGSTFVWTRDNPSGIITTIPLSGTASNIGDVLSGSFTNISNDPKKITFLITPIGPAPTYCVGIQIPASVVVNPTPRVIPINAQPTICYGQSAAITLTSPTTMTKGAVMFDYFVTFEGLPGELVGNNAPQMNLLPGHFINYPYQNNSDTIRSVFYTITPKNNSLGCIYDSINIPEVKVHPRPLQSMYISTPFTCTGGSSGVITTVLSRGSKPDILTWTERPWTGDTTYTTSANSSDLPIRYAGRYNLTVKDNFGCVNSIYNLEVLGAVFKTNFYVNDTTGYGTTCPGYTDGEIWIWEASSSTAVPPYVYWLVHNGQDTIRTGTLSAKNEVRQEKNLPSGHYRIIVRDANGCLNMDYPEADITEPPAVAVAFGKSDYSGYNISCRGYNDGSVWIESVTGGNGRYSYFWYTNDGMISGPDNLDRLDDIPAGTYYLVTTDRKGCTKLDSVVVIQPDGMSLDAYRLSFSPDSAYNISCHGGNDGFIEMTISGGAAPYIFAWADSAASFTAATRDIKDLYAGTYYCKVTDQNGCELKILPASNYPTFVLTEPPPLSIDVLTSESVNGPYNIDCNGGTGWIDITVSGGSTNPYDYSWSTTDGSAPVEGQEDQWSLTAGSYRVFVRDSNLCEMDSTIILTQPDSVTTSLIPTHITCQPPGFANGSIDLTASGGVGPYGNWSWSNGATTEDISGLTEGYYTVTLTDANGCPKTDSVRINLPPPLTFTAELSDYTGFNVTCNGLSDGWINITMDSGLAPYIYEWQKVGGGFTDSRDSIGGLNAGYYILKVTDANMCTETDTIEMTEPGTLGMNMTFSSSIVGGYNINCAGASTGSVAVVPINAAGIVNYLWSDGAVTATRENIPAGEYGIYIEDANGCWIDSTFTLTEPDSIRIIFEVTQPWCPDKPDGAISLTVTGGVPGADYNYHWSDNSTGRDITNILEGNFIVTVTDLNGCSISDSIIVEPQRKTCLIIPNAISPNGDLINDVWNIGEIELYPDIEIRIFNRWGETVWRSEKGYPQPWDGRSNGRILPIDSYHYIIDLGKKRKPIIGNITIVR